MTDYILGMVERGRRDCSEDRQGVPDVPRGTGGVAGEDAQPRRGRHPQAAAQDHVQERSPIRVSESNLI